jgi:hypothetical protein
MKTKLDQRMFLLIENGLLYYCSSIGWRTVENFRRKVDKKLWLLGRLWSSLGGWQTQISLWAALGKKLLKISARTNHDKKFGDKKLENRRDLVLSLGRKNLVLAAGWPPLIHLIRGFREASTKWGQFWCSMHYSDDLRVVRNLVKITGEVMVSDLRPKYFQSFLN